MYLTNSNSNRNSFLDVGYFDTAKMSSADDMVEIPILNEDFHWSNTVKGIKFANDDQGYSDEWGFEEHKAFLDSGTSFITISFLYWDWFLDFLSSKLTKGFTIYEEDSDRRGRLYILTDCDEDFKNLPIISLLFGGTWFEIIP